MKQTFKDHKFAEKSLELIVKVIDIIEDYTAQGYELTLRQVFYQLVSRAIIPNNQREYDKLGTLVSNARLAGLIDWKAIADRTRYVRTYEFWDSPADIVRSSAIRYRRDKWVNCSNYVEVWVEKDALIDVVEQAVDETEVACFSCRGYVSLSAMYQAAQRFMLAENEGKMCHLIHLGDHDPSGIDMSRDIQDRLNTFGTTVLVDRIALNMDQVDQYNPPPNPAKLTDSRAGDYIINYGTDSWELDALDPSVLDELIKDKVEQLIDRDAWNAERDQQEGERTAIEDAADELEENA